MSNPLHPNLFQSQNVFKVKGAFVAADGMGQHPQVRSWWRPASAAAAGGRAAELSGEDVAWYKKATQACKGCPERKVYRLGVGEIFWNL